MPRRHGAVTSADRSGRSARVLSNQRKRDGEAEMCRRVVRGGPDDLFKDAARMLPRCGRSSQALVPRKAWCGASSRVERF